MRAIINDGTIRCWVRNDYGHLADGTESVRYTLRIVYGLDNIVDVNLGFGFTFFSTSDNALYCVGNNNYGQIGVGDNVRRKALQRVLI